MADTAPAAYSNPDWMKWCTYMDLLLQRAQPVLRETAPKDVELSIPPMVLHTLHVHTTQCNGKFSAENTAYALPQHTRAHCVTQALRWHNAMHKYAENCNVTDCEERSSPMWCVIADRMGFTVDHLQSMYDMLPDVDKTMLWEYIKKLNATAQAVSDSVHAIGWDAVLNGTSPAVTPAPASALADAFRDALPGGEAQLKEIQAQMMNGGGLGAAFGSLLTTPGMMQSVLPATMRVMQDMPKEQLEAMAASASSLLGMQGAAPAKAEAPKPDTVASGGKDSGAGGGSGAGSGGHGGDGHGGDE